MKISIGFSTTNTFISRAIRWFLGSNISHTYIRIYDEYLKTPLILHADWPGVVIVHANKFDKENIVVREYEVDSTNLDKSLQKNLRLLGKSYDYPSLFGWAWTIAFKRWFNKKIQNPLDDPKKLICVDFVLRITNDAGLTSLPVGSMDPNTLDKWCMNNYEALGWKVNDRSQDNN